MNVFTLIKLSARAIFLQKVFCVRKSKQRSEIFYANTKLFFTNNLRDNSHVMQLTTFILNKNIDRKSFMESRLVQVAKTDLMAKWIELLPLKR